MAVIKNKSYTVVFYAWNTHNNSPVIGDANNIIVRISKDGGATVATAGNPFEIDSLHAPGWYGITLTDAEMNADTILVVPKSLTSNVACTQILILTDKSYCSYTYDIKQKTDKLSFVDNPPVSYVQSTVASYATGLSPAQQVLATPANKLNTDASGRVTVAVNHDKSGYSLATTEHVSIANAVWNATARTLTDATNIASTVFSYLIEGTKSFAEYIKIMAAVLFGNVTGGQTGNIVIKSPVDTNKTRVNADVDQHGNRNVTNIDGN